jgi:radical SAM superfamily enzyme YgiQ (UPF0313 family)
MASRGRVTGAGGRRRDPREVARERLVDERGTIIKEAPRRVALIYPSPYRVGMSSLGYQTIYREINDHPECAAERAFLPEEVARFRKGKNPLFCYESGRPVGDFPVVGLSVAYELELVGMLQALRLSSIPLLAEERGPRDPLVLAGGPLTFANPLPLAPFADAILMGEADQTIHRALDAIAGCGNREEARAVLATEIKSCFVPLLHGEQMPICARCHRDRLPAYAAIRTRRAELCEMFLVEAVRGCSRDCDYCVMRRSGRSTMRIVPESRILAKIPDEARRIGLVGAGVSDHPAIADIVERLAGQGREVGLSSLRPDRLDDRLVGALRGAGARTLTTALDGSSQRLRDRIHRHARADHVLCAARLARKHCYRKLKLYVMVGLPDEGDEDIDELIDLSLEVSRIQSLKLSVSPFVPKRNTPLKSAPFAGVKVIEQRLRRLRTGLGGKVEMRADSARWAWVEYRLAQGGPAEGRALMGATVKGGKLADLKRALG